MNETQPDKRALDDVNRYLYKKLKEIRNITYDTLKSIMNKDNYSQNNYNDNESKSIKKNKNNIIFEKLANKTIFNGFSSVNNNIINHLNDFISKNKTLEKDKIGNKIKKIGVIRKNKNKNKDKTKYIIKIQKIFRGYIFRKKYKNEKNTLEKMHSNIGIYIRKKYFIKRRII